MNRFLQLTAAGLAAALIVLPTAQRSQAQAFSPDQRREIQQIVKEFLLKNPEVLTEVVAELEKRQAAAEADKHKAGIAKHREALFNSSRQVTLGNPRGDVTLVEFFDYNCGYCKRAMNDKLELIKSDPKLKVVIKEFPVLGPGSIEAAQVSIAVAMQDKGAKKYLDFHQKLLMGRGQADRARALAAARDAGIDMARLERDMQTAEVKAALEESMMLAEALGINGTPSYVVGDNVVAGAVGVATLRQQIDAARKAVR